MTGDPWHGPNVLALLDGDLTPDEAARTPVPGGHSIWELVLHMTGWAREVQARLAGAAAASRPPATGRRCPSPSCRRPGSAIADAVRGSLRRWPPPSAARRPAMLDQPVIDHRDRAPGTGLSRYLTLHGLVHHTVYHAGQIAQLRRALRS